MEKLVVTRIREYIKEQKELSVSKDYFLKLEQELNKLVLASCNRCLENDRRTLMARDL